MPSAIIHYQNSNALRTLQQLGNSLGFTVDTSNESEILPLESKGQIAFINGIPYQEVNPKADITRILGIFDGNNYTKQSLRDKTWKKR